jgi:hypothetical protein
MSYFFVLMPLLKLSDISDLGSLIEAQHGDESQVRFIAQGVTVPRMRPTEVWLAYRVHTFHWTPREYTSATCENTFHCKMSTGTSETSRLSTSRLDTCSEVQAREEQ